VVLEE